MIGRRLGVAMSALTLAAGSVACGSADGSASPSSEPAKESSSEPSSESSSEPSTSVAALQRIIPLNGDVAEIVFALGLGDQVVATDLSATHPEAAAALPKFGFERALNTEPILEFEPSVVVGTDAAAPQDTIDDLVRVQVPVTIIEREFSSNGPADKIRQVAESLGVGERGDELADAVQSEIDEATVGSDAYSAPLRVVALYFRGSDLQFVLGAGSGIDWIIDAAGAVDVANELGVGVTAPITSEALLAAAPDVIIVPEGGLESAGGLDALLAVPGIAETPAGRRGAILAYDDQLMLGNGPRTGEFLAELVDDFSAVDQLRTNPEDDS